MKHQTRHGTAHLHAQEVPHDQAYLISDRAALLDLRDAIDAALEAPDGVGRAEIFAASEAREGYTLFVLAAPEEELGASETPYTSANALDPRPDAVPRPPFCFAGRGEASPNAVASTIACAPRAKDHARASSPNPVPHVTTVARPPGLPI